MEKQKFSDQELQERILTLKTGSTWDKGVAAYQLGNNQDSRALDALIEALKDEDKSVRETAASAIGNLGDLEGFEPLVAHLTEDEPILSIMWSLIRLDKKRAAQYIFPYLRHENILAQKIAIITGSRTGNAEIFRVLAELIHHQELKDQVIISLAFSEDPQGIPILITLLKDKNYDLRYRIVWALRKIRHEQCVHYLISMLEDFYPFTAREAHKALNEINTLEARTAVQTWRQKRYARKQQYKRHKKE